MIRRNIWYTRYDTSVSNIHIAGVFSILIFIQVKRKQFLLTLNVCSACKEVIYGIPHGVIFGGDLFITDVDYICNVSALLACASFSYGKNVFCS